MTAQEVKDYISAQLVAPVNQVIKVINSLFRVVDFISTSVAADVIPDWTTVLVFNTDGSGAGRYCKHPDTNGRKRIFQTKTDANVNNVPPTNPLITENTHWIEVSPSASAPIPEWSAGVFGTGLVIVYHNHSVDGRGLYVLLEPVRPFTSSNIETEVTAGKWERMGGSGSGKGVAHTYDDIADMLADQAAQKQDFFYLVTDASADATVDAGWAMYQKLAANTAAIGDYRKLNEGESLDVIISATPDWSDTVKGKVERSTTAESQNIVTRTAAASSNSSNDDGRTPSEKGLVEMLLSFLATAWTWASKQTFTTAIRLTSTTASQFLRADSNKDVVSVPAASQSDMITGTDNVNPATAASVEAKRSVKRASASVSSGTMTLNAGSKEEIKFEATTAISSSFAVAFSNWANAEIINVILPITGSVPITMPDGTGGTPNIIMEASDGRYVSKVLTVVGTTASPFELSFNRISSDRFLLRVSDRYPAS